WQMSRATPRADAAPWPRRNSRARQGSTPSNSRPSPWRDASRWSRLEFVSGPEDDPDGRKARAEEDEDHREPDPYVDDTDAVEAPANPADEVHDRVEQRDLLPERRQHVDRVETAAQKRQRGHHHQRHDLQLFPPIGPDADDEAEEAESHGGQQQRGHHPERVSDAEGDEQPRGEQDDGAEDDRFGCGRTYITDDDL